MSTRKSNMKGKCGHVGHLGTLGVYAASGIVGEEECL